MRLTFEIAGEVDVNMPVGAPNAKMGGMQMHGMPKASGHALNRFKSHLLASPQRLLLCCFR